MGIDGGAKVRKIAVGMVLAALATSATAQADGGATAQADGGATAQADGGARALAARACHTSAGPTITITRVRNIGCGAAARVMGSYNRPIRKRFRVKGFRCVQSRGGRLAGAWKCARGKRAFRFSFGD
jgi:hypothetical protein